MSDILKLRRMQLTLQVGRFIHLTKRVINDKITHLARAPDGDDMIVIIVKQKLIEISRRIMCILKPDEYFNNNISKNTP